MFGEKIKAYREQQGLKLKELAAKTLIDQTLLSRFEKGSRLPTDQQLTALASGLNTDPQELRVHWLAEKIVKVVQYEPIAIEAMMVAEERVEYLSSKAVLEFPKISPRIQSKLIQIDELKAKWQSKHPLGPSHLKRLREYFDIQYTFESNRIEGNTLSLRETDLIINKGLTIGDKSMQEHLEAVNHAEAIDYVADLVLAKLNLNKRNILDIHRLILKGIDTENAGVYRKVPVRISGSTNELPQPHRLEPMMLDYFQFYQFHRKRLHPVIMAAEMHERLVSIHPFIDGNGRTARLVMNLILMRHGYTRANIKGSTESRARYYEALDAVQSDANHEYLYELVVDECIESLREHLELT
ncbi:MAG: Fic family protein [Cytophagales bacterium]|nr:Fic family protein [Cytophagales bacterium]